MNLSAPLNIIVTVIGELLIVVASILSASISMRQTIIKLNAEGQLQDFIQSENKAHVLSMLPMRTLLIRNTLVLALFVGMLIVLCGGLFGSVIWTRQFFESERIRILIGSGIAIGGMATAIYVMFYSFGIIELVLDRCLFKTIWQAFYTDESDKSTKTVLFEFLKKLGFIAGLGVLFSSVINAFIWFEAWIK